MESIRANGILNPLLITEDGCIISGHRRWDAARQLGLADVPAVLFGSEDDLDILEALIESNRQRNKDGEIIGREYNVLKRIIHERESRQGNNQHTQPKNGASGKRFPDAPAPTRQAAAQLGVSRPTADKAARTVEAIDQLEQEGKTREAQQLRSTLKHNINKAYSH